MTRLADAIREAKAEALLVTNLINIRYLTGFTGSNALLAVFPDHSIFWTDPRYTLQAAREVGPDVRISKKPLLVAAEQYLSRRKIRRVGFEREHMRFDQYQVLNKRTTLIPVSASVERLRAVKSDAEVQKIRAAVNTNSAAFESALKAVKPGMREADLASLIDYRMRRLGAESASFDTIVAAGDRSALPHARPAATRFTDRQLVLVDMGSTQDGYTSDMTRMFHLGRPSPKLRATYAVVLEAQLAAIAAIRPRVTGAAVDKAARNVFERHSLEDQFVHSTGHGLGLEIHEEPRLGKKSKTRLEAGMVVTVEPGVYLEGWGGIRIEDTVLVTANGCEVLTPTSKELRIVHPTVT